MIQPRAVETTTPTSPVATLGAQVSGAGSGNGRGEAAVSEPTTVWLALAAAVLVLIFGEAGRHRKYQQLINAWHWSPESSKIYLPNILVGGHDLPPSNASTT